MAKTSKASKTVAARRARVEELQRAQRAKERRRTLIAVGAIGAVVLVVAIVPAIVLTRGGSDDSTGGPGLNTADQIIPAGITSGATTTEKTPEKVDPPAGVDIAGLLAWDTAGYPASGTAGPGTVEHGHVEGPVKYAVTPPIGGPHNGIWMNAGVYTKPVPTERAVHDMEHGAIWITYNPNLPQVQINQLVKFVASQSMIPEADQQSPGQANRYIVMSPWSDNSLPTPIVLSSWGYQLQVNNPTDSKSQMQDFVDTFRNSDTYTPEQGSPVDGIPVQTGGRPAGYGSKNANPPGIAQ